MPHAKSRILGIMSEMAHSLAQQLLGYERVSESYFPSPLLPFSIFTARFLLPRVLINNNINIIYIVSPLCTKSLLAYSLCEIGSPSTKPQQIRCVV